MNVKCDKYINRELKTGQVKNILGYSSREEIIHKDDLAKV